MFAAQFHISCHSSRQNLEIQGLSSDAGNFTLMGGKERASLAATKHEMTDVATATELRLKDTMRELCAVDCVQDDDALQIPLRSLSL